MNSVAFTGLPALGFMPQINFPVRGGAALVFCLDSGTEREGDFYPLGHRLSAEWLLPREVTPAFCLCLLRDKERDTPGLPSFHPAARPCSLRFLILGDMDDPAGTGKAGLTTGQDRPP